MTDTLPLKLPAESARRLAITVGQYSAAGAKPENQDFYGVLEPEGADLAAKGIAVCIADGISTSQLGAAAAETAVKSFLTDYVCTSPAWSVRLSGERVIAATNSWMHAQNRRANGPPETDEQRERGLVCTFSALVLKGSSAHIFHIGDAQILHISAQDRVILTEPHRVYLGGGQSYLGRALGVNRNVEVDYRQVPVAAGDLFVLTTDGIHEHLDGDTIAAAIERAASLDLAARAIGDAALEAGSTDNLTVQIVRIESLPESGLDDLIGSEAALLPAPLLEPGQEFEGFRILSVLHAGSRSHVYRARTLASGNDVALKILSTEKAQDPDAVTALMLEEWIMRRLDHPNLLHAPAPTQKRRHAFSVSELVEGQDLDAWMLDHKTPELAVVRDFVRQIASGLHAMHRREMIHRDLRPQNILLDSSGRLKIIDFGSAQVAGLDELVPQALEAAFAGTMQYSAPELYLGQSASFRSDLYSLGVIAYQMLTGHLPYGPRVATATTPSAQRKLVYTPVTQHNADVPEWMDAAIAKAVSINPAKRYDELSEFVVDLAKPNRSFSSPHHVPLLQRGSVRAWQIISALLAAALVVAVLTRPSAPEGMARAQHEVAQ